MTLRGHDRVHVPFKGVGISALLMLAFYLPTATRAVTVSSVRAGQRIGTQLVDIRYNLAGTGGVYAVAVAVSTNNGTTYDLPSPSMVNGGNASSVGVGVTPGLNKWIVWNAGTDWGGQYSDQVRFQIAASGTSPAPPGMVLIPAGSFVMGNATNVFPASEGDPSELPQHVIQVSAFYMDRYLVTKALWDDVANWAAAHGYDISAGSGSGKATNHPVQMVSWYECVKWCNARSQKEGRMPCYYTSEALNVIYTNGSVNVETNWANWNTDGYRLPTEAEWEKAARGGAQGHRFPWSESDEIQHARANYYSSASLAYDTSPTRGYHPAFATGSLPYTSPVGYFAANGYGLYDMAGNVWEWCWDWFSYNYYSNSPVTDPRGIASFGTRVMRGGRWGFVANWSRVALRNSDYPSNGDNTYGFRCARSR